MHLYSFLKFILMEEFAFLFFILPVMILINMKVHLNVGVPSSQLKRFYYLLSACWLVTTFNTIISVFYHLSFSHPPSLSMQNLMMNLVLILMHANCGDLIVKSLMKSFMETLENHLVWNKMINSLQLLIKDPVIHALL